MLKKITSRSNPIIKNLVTLHEKDQRRQQGLFIAEGLRTCITLLQSKIKLEQLFVTHEHLDQAYQLLPENLITFVDKSVMEKISTTKSPSGILGVFVIPKQTAYQLQSGLVLANITDPGNMGTLIRTCAAMNKKTVVVVEGVDPWHPKTVQASAGTIGSVEIIECNWEYIIKNKKNIDLCALVVNGGAAIETINLKNALLVVGNEAHGLPNQWLASCDKKITLTMPGNTESLNAAAAGSIACYLAWK